MMLSVLTFRRAVFAVTVLLLVPCSGCLVRREGAAGSQVEGMTRQEEDAYVAEMLAADAQPPDTP